MFIKQKSLSLPRKLALGISGKLLIIFSEKIHLLHLLYSTVQRCCLLHLVKNFSKNHNLHDTGISLSVFHSRTNLKLHHLTVTSKLVKVITNLDLSKPSSPDCIPVVALKNCEPELSYILAQLFNISLK